jgi:tRNA(Arg) A34 adenosine deaminase TadA
MEYITDPSLMKKRDKELLNYCIKKASEQRVHGRQTLYAVVVNRRKQILAGACNSYTKSHPAQKGSDPYNKIIYLHAEIRALVKLRYNAVPYAIYVARACGIRAGLAKPCKICQEAIKASGIEKCYHT